MNSFGACLVLLWLTVFIAFVNVHAQPALGSAFVDYVAKRVDPTSENAFNKFCAIDQSRFARKIFIEYGAMFVASNEVQLPPSCYFPDETSAAKFQLTLKTSTALVDGIEIRLQAPAMASFMKVLDAAKQLNVRIVPLDGPIAAARTYSDTVTIWNSRYEPALQFWVNRGKIMPDEAAQLASMSFESRIGRVIDWESQGYLFGTGLRSSIFSSTAPPGASQHLSLIAFDMAGNVTPLVTAIFNASGWFQTVKGDPGHFTYLGVFEGELPKRGLRQVYLNGHRYWVPDLPDSPVTNRQD